MRFVLLIVVALSHSLVPICSILLSDNTTFIHFSGEGHIGCFVFFFNIARKATVNSTEHVLFDTCVEVLQLCGISSLESRHLIRYCQIVLHCDFITSRQFV